MNIDENNAPIENQIREVIIKSWKKELKIDDIKLEEDFFDLGGHSLKLINILDSFHKNELYPQLNKLSLMDLFEYTTIQSLTAFAIKL